MIKYTDEVKLYNFVNFVKKLEEHALSAEHFFDNAFLTLLGDCFHFHNSAITVYDNCFQYAGSVSYGPHSEFFINAYQKKHFFENDYIAKYITSNFSHLTMPEKVFVITGTEILSGDDLGQKQYRDFLTEAGLKYIAVLPVDANYRIAIYKEENEGDFSEDELDILNCVLPIIRNRYLNFKSDQVRRHESHIKSMLISEMNIGYIILDRDYAILDYNSEAIQYLHDITGISHINSSVATIIEKINSCDDAIQKWPYSIAISNYSEAGFCGILRKFYCIKIKPMASRATPQFLPFDVLSDREIEVLDSFAKGMEYKDIAKALYISECTIRTHLRNIYQKLGIDNQRKLIFEYLQYIAFKQK